MSFQRQTLSQPGSVDAWEPGLGTGTVPGRPWWAPVFRLRAEEAVALAFLAPTTYLVVVANLYTAREGLAFSRAPAAIARLAIAVGLLLLLWVERRRRPHSRLLHGLREVLPFLICVLIYTNLHDTIGFANPHDIHQTLAAFDHWLFGAQPTVWAERLVTPQRTELMSFFYWNFFWIASSDSVLLLLARRWRAFRTATAGVITCFFLGYLLYVAFPAAPPRLALASQYRATLSGFPIGVARLSDYALTLLPVDSRAAFPSLHAAVSLLALLYAWRYLRPWFYVLLPFVAGLLASTIYLRHHFVADLLASAALAPLAAWLAPRADRWWTAWQRRLGYPTALGAEPERDPLAGDAPRR